MCNNKANKGIISITYLFSFGMVPLGSAGIHWNRTERFQMELFLQRTQKSTDSGSKWNGSKGSSVNARPISTNSLFVRSRNWNEDGTERLCSRMSAKQCWYEIAPFPLEQPICSFQKLKRRWHGTIVFPCECKAISERLRLCVN